MVILLIYNHLRDAPQNGSDRQQGCLCEDLLISIPPDPLFKGAIRAFGLSIPHGFPCSPTPARHLMMPCSALEGGTHEVGWPGPHGGFLLPRITTSVRHNWRLLPDTIASERHVQREKPNNLKLTQLTKVLIHNQLVDKAKARLPTFSHNLHLATRHIYLTLSTIR